MAITLQARQADGTWAIRNAFVTENKQVTIGAMKAADLEAKARAVMAQWQATMQDGKPLRVHNSDNDPKPARRLPSSEATARADGWRTTQEAHGDGAESYGVVHPDGRWAPDFEAATRMRDVRPQVLKMRQCFFCGDNIGLMTDDDYDDLDTCGARACTREARIEGRERIEEERDWACA